METKMATTALVALVILLVLAVVTASLTPSGTAGGRDGSGVGRMKRIFGGTQTGPTQYLVGVDNLDDRGSVMMYCGGTAIGKNWIITAAHCVENVKDNVVQVIVFGSDFFANGSTPAIDIPARNVFIFPNYDERANEVKHDIALLKVEGLDLEKYIDINKDNTCPKADQICRILGVDHNNGMVEFRDLALHEVELPVWNTEYCKNTLNQNWIEDPFMFCMGWANNAKSTCAEDEGGPVVCKCNGKEVLTGVVSWTRSCGHANTPGVHLRIAPYVHWINNCTRSTSSLDCPRKSEARRPAPPPVSSTRCCMRGEVPKWDNCNNCQPPQADNRPCCENYGHPMGKRQLFSKPGRYGNSGYQGNAGYGGHNCRQCYHQQG